MNAEPSVKLVKKGERKGAEPQAKIECSVDLIDGPQRFSRGFVNFKSIVAAAAPCLNRIDGCAEQW